MSYYDRQGNQISADNWPSMEDRRVALTEVSDDVSVSTVHLVLDHGYGGGPPVLFETMVFGGDHDQDMWRYCTEAQAQAGHAAVVTWLRGEGPEPTE